MSLQRHHEAATVSAKKKKESSQVEVNLRFDVRIRHNNKKTLLTENGADHAGGNEVNPISIPLARQKT